MKSTRSKLVLFIILSVILIGIAVFAWAEYSGKINIFASECSTPVCSNIGSKSEGWTDDCGFSKWDNCNGCTAVCGAVGSKSEGWYKRCAGKKDELIKWANCSNQQNSCEKLGGYCAPIAMCASSSSCAICPGTDVQISEGTCPNNFPCCKKSDNPCVELGGRGPNGSIGPSDPNKDKVCCEGLTTKDPITKIDDNGKCEYAIGAGTVCLACGDGKCDSKYENKCNCPEDCDPDRPTPPKNVKANVNGQNSIKITWDGMSKDKVKSFVVHQNPPVGTVNNPGEGQIASFEISGLLCGTEYTYYVVATNNFGDSAPSESVTARTNNCQGPGPSPTPSPSPNPFSNISHLVSTGSSLQLNLILALIGIAGIGYFIFRSDVWKK